MPSNNRVPAHPVSAIFTDRWSPRAFTGATIDEATLLTFFEAARWAPSSYNSQPWTFLYARRDTPHFETFLSLFNERNQLWAKNASALIVVTSKTTFTAPGQSQPAPAASHSFDAGAAWSNLAHQASLSGWHAHGVGGFDAQKARALLNIPADQHVDVAVAIGKRGDKSLIPEAFHRGEEPNGRKPLTEIVHEGPFAAA